MSDTTAAGVPLWYVRQRNRELAEMQARAEEAEAEIERLKQGYLAAGVNSLRWRE